MIKSIGLFGILSMIALASCDNNNKEKDDTYTAPPPAPVEQTTQPAPAKQKDGTTIKVNEQGVSYENKDGGNKQKINLSKDSTSIEISKPK